MTILNQIYASGGDVIIPTLEPTCAASGGATLGASTSTAPFGDRPMTFRVRGEITSGSLVIDRVRVVLWG